MNRRQVEWQGKSLGRPPAVLLLDQRDYRVQGSNKVRALVSLAGVLSDQRQGARQLSLPLGSSLSPCTPAPAIPRNDSWRRDSCGDLKEKKLIVMGRLMNLKWSGAGNRLMADVI